MKPAWDKLMLKFADSTSVLVADVDCTAGGEALCQQIGVEGYPTIKHGDPSDLQDYEGGRDEEELEEFAGTLGPSCSVANIELCDAEKKALIQKYQQMPADKLEEFIVSKEGEQKKIEADFDTFVEGLQASYEEAETKKKTDLAAIKDSGLGMAKSVRASSGVKGGAEEDTEEL